MEQSFQFNKLFEIVLSGGWVMVPLAILAVLIYTTAFQLLLYVRRGSVTTDQSQHWKEWITHPEKAEGRVGDIIRYTCQAGYSQKELRNRFEEVRVALISIINRRLNFLQTLVGVAPLLGLLGTVIGMLTMFSGIATQGGGETANIVAEGIAEALITTQTGLVVALPGLFLAMVIQRRKHSIEASLARLESMALTNNKFRN